MRPNAVEDVKSFPSQGVRTVVRRRGGLCSGCFFQAATMFRFAGDLNVRTERLSADWEGGRPLKTV